MYTSELMRTVNNETERTQYYVRKCGVFTRISKAEYNERRDSADGVSCLYTKAKGKFTRHYTTITMYA